MKTKKNIQIFKLMKFIARQFPIWISCSIIIRIIFGIIPFVQLNLTKYIVNEVSDFVQNVSVIPKSIIYLLIIQFLVLILKSFIKHFSELYDKHIEIKLDYHISRKIAEKILYCPYIYLEFPGFYDHKERIRGNNGNKLMSPIKNILDILESTISLLSFITFLFTIHWMLVILSLIASIPTLIILSKFGNKKFNLFRFQTPFFRESNYVYALLSNKNASKEIRLFNLGDYFIERWTKIFQKRHKEILSLYTKEKTANVFLDISKSIIYTIAAITVIYLLKNKKLSIGDFVSTGQAIQGSQDYVNNIASHLARLYEQNLFIDDLFSFLEYELNLNYLTSKEKTVTLEEIKNGITANNICFQYPDSNKLVLKDINFHIKKGESIAIVGENGSGKSTLIKCLLGLYSLNMGKITFDNHNLEDIESKSLKKLVSVIFQDFMKYAFNVKENIFFGDIYNKGSIKDIKDASIKSGADKFIDRLPDKYETILGKYLADGEDLSGGEWQRLAIARALFGDTDLLVLDEPTASLDPKTEIEIYNRIKQTTHNKTTIFISHRMAAAKMADRIFVMKNGTLIEVGTHDELMELRKEYYQMFKIQSKWYA
jgi:ATP-binding cassette, subfamily B, bacterial